MTCFFSACLRVSWTLRLLVDRYRDGGVATGKVWPQRSTAWVNWLSQLACHRSDLCNGTNDFSALLFYVCLCLIYTSSWRIFYAIYTLKKTLWHQKHDSRPPQAWLRMLSVKVEHWPVWTAASTPPAPVEDARTHHPLPHLHPCTTGEHWWNQQKAGGRRTEFGADDCDCPSCSLCCAGYPHTNSRGHFERPGFWTADPLRDHWASVGQVTFEPC